MVTGYLVDTNVPSELTRPVPEYRVPKFLEKAGRENLYISVLSLGGICKGIAQLPVSQECNELQG